MVERAAGVDVAEGEDLEVPDQPIDLHHPQQRSEIEDGMSAIPGVVASRIVPGFDRTVDEVHVLTTTERSPKQVVRDVQTYLLTRHGVSTDHRVISVAQIDDDPISAATIGDRRVSIATVESTQDGLQLQIKVTVRDGTQLIDGESQGPASPAGRRRATARATLEAIRPLLPADQVVELEGAEVTDVLGRELAICLVHFHTPRGETTNCGSAMIRGDEADAVARALLDAVNRAISQA
jgi:hypothetical protein